MEQSSQGHEFVELPGMTLTGMAIDCPGFDTSGIPALWDRFITRCYELAAEGKLPQDKVVWGASLPAADGFRYLAGFEGDLGPDVPSDFESATLPPARYIKVPFKGLPSEMGAQFQRIFHEVMPPLGHSIKPGFHCLEQYPPDPFDEATGQLSADLYVELK